ncbi:MAG: molybdopterin-dependent oxidoreductase [Anaerolineales bacterium]|nr:molybdopterin-dependent oxidoreductase [Anaerolineales bacterium]
MLETIQQLKESETPEHEVVTGLCGVCPAGCINHIHLVNGKIERMTPIKGHPYSMVCPRGARAKEIVYSPDRILYPQRRVGARGEGKFERITWDQAYEFIVDGLQGIARRYGPQAAAVYTGRGNFEYGLYETFAPSGTVESSANAVLFPFGSPNTSGVGSLCYVSYGMIASRACFGEYMRNIYEDIDNADLILLWGENPATDSPPTNLLRIKQAQKRGARVIVIDHRRSETARALHAEWIGVRPGADGALALGLINILIEEQLYDRDLVENWSHGFAELKSYVRSFTPERVEEITWVPAERVRELGKAIGSAKACSLMTYTGLEYSNSGVQAIRAAWILQALAGHLDAPGGKLFRMREHPRLQRLLTEPPVNGPRPVGADEFPLYHATRNEAHALLFPKAILENEPYPLRGLIIGGASIITSWPNPALWQRALAALDLLVVINRFPTADAQYADILLPATTMFEIESYMLQDDYLFLRPRIIPPLGEARNDYLIFAELAQRLGYGHLWPQTERGMIEYALSGAGVTLEDLHANPEGIRLPAPEMRYRKYASGGLRADGKPGFETPTGKLEIASEWLRQYGYDALPAYIDPVEGPLSKPELAQVYPLVFNSGARTHYDFRSQHHNIPSLLAMHPHPLVYLHVSDAQARGILDGDEVYVVTARGREVFHARVTEDILPGVVEVNMGGGGPLGPPAWRRANVNVLTDMENVEEISGFPVYKALLCDVIRKVQTSVEE